jgi:hypothetical protein
MFLYSAAKSYLWGDDPNAPVTIHISWLGKRFLLEFDPTEFPMATVGDLRRECADETLVEPERVRLIHKGSMSPSTNANVFISTIKRRSDQVD